MNKVKITERGWPGHYVCCGRCVFHRNTLIQVGRKRVIVSTVGNQRNREDEGKIETIGCQRYYETKAFEARKEGPYWEANVGKGIDFRGRWSICAENVEQLPDNVDNVADRIHDAVVYKMIRRLVSE